MGKFQVDVERPSEDRAAFVKALRTVGGISLKRAAGIAVHVDRSHNITLVAGVEQRTAEHIAKTLGASGAVAVVRDSAVTTPMMYCAEADQRNKWGGIRTIVKAR